MAVENTWRKHSEYIGGPKAAETFEEGMKASFNVSKGAVVRGEKKQVEEAWPVLSGTDLYKVAGPQGIVVRVYEPDWGTLRPRQSVWLKL